MSLTDYVMQNVTDLKGNAVSAATFQLDSAQANDTLTLEQKVAVLFKEQCVFDLAYYEGGKQYVACIVIPARLTDAVSLPAVLEELARQVGTVIVYSERMGDKRGVMTPDTRSWTQHLAQQIATARS